MTGERRREKKRKREQSPMCYTPGNLMEYELVKRTSRTGRLKERSVDCPFVYSNYYYKMFKTP